MKYMMSKKSPELASYILEEKQRIRKLLLTRRRSEDPDKLFQWSGLIRRRLEDNPLWQTCSFPCIYISSKPGEVETHTLIRSALAEGKKVCVPVIEPEEKTLRLVRIHSLDNLVPGPFDVLEPERGKRIEGEMFDPHAVHPPWDLAVVPGVAFDRAGNRLGFGKGYYDRLLAGTKIPRIALAFSFQIVDTFRTLPHDVPMDMIITEKETIELGGP